MSSSNVEQSTVLSARQIYQEHKLWYMPGVIAAMVDSLVKYNCSTIGVDKLDCVSTIDFIKSIGHIIGLMSNRRKNMFNIILFCSVIFTDAKAALNAFTELIERCFSLSSLLATSFKSEKNMSVNERYGVRAVYWANVKSHVFAINGSLNKLKHLTRTDSWDIYANAFQIARLRMFFMAGIQFEVTTDFDEFCSRAKDPKFDCSKEPSLLSTSLHRVQTSTEASTGSSGSNSLVTDWDGQTFDSSKEPFFKIGGCFFRYSSELLFEVFGAVANSIVVMPKSYKSGTKLCFCSNFDMSCALKLTLKHTNTHVTILSDDKRLKRLFRVHTNSTAELRDIASQLYNKKMIPRFDFYPYAMFMLAVHNRVTYINKRTRYDPRCIKFSGTVRTTLPVYLNCSKFSSENAFWDCKPSDEFGPTTTSDLRAFNHGLKSIEVHWKHSMSQYGTHNSSQRLFPGSEPSVPEASVPVNCITMIDNNILYTNTMFLDLQSP